MKLEDLIRKFREEQHLTMQEFADRCKLSKGYVSMLEKGRHPASQRRLVPSLETLKKISVGMGLSMDELLLMLDGDMTVSLMRDPVPDERHELLIRLFDALPPEVQDMLLVQAQALVDRQRSQDDP